MGEGKGAFGEKICNSLVGSTKFLIIAYAIVLGAYLAGFTAVEPLFTVVGAVVLWGIVFTTYALGT